MPELPEVETIRLGLQKCVVGHTIAEVEVRLAKMFSGSVKDIVGAKIIAVRRLGKGLVIDLDNGYSLAVHVKMTGQLIYKGTKGPKEKKGTEVLNLPDKYTHVRFTLDNEAVLYYRDMRQFGWIKVLSTKDVMDMPFFKSLGKEPLRDLTFDDFQTILQKYKTPIKLLLMDQRKIAGIGNIYANDALYLAKIHPKRPAARLSNSEMRALFDAIEQVLRKGIEVGGASQWHYVDVLGERGQYQNFFQVYQKNGEPCPRCGVRIEKTQLGGRGTFFCPVCQTP